MSRYTPWLLLLAQIVAYGTLLSMYRHQQEALRQLHARVRALEAK